MDDRKQRFYFIMIFWLVWSELLKSFSVLCIWKWEELPKVGWELKEIFIVRCVQIVSDSPPQKYLQDTDFRKVDIQILCRSEK